MPAYNAATFIGRTLETLLCQTYRDFIIIVSDNHSSDKTVEVVKRYQLIDNRIFLTQCPINALDGSLRSESMSSKPNHDHVISLAQTEFLAVYHADDLYHRDILAQQVAFLSKYPELSVAFTMGRILDHDGMMVSVLPIQTPDSLCGKNIYSYNELLSSLIFHKLQLLTPTCMGRTDAFGKVCPTEAKYEQAGDYYLWLRMAGVGKIGVIDRPLLLRRVGKHSDTFRGLTLYRHKMSPGVQLLEDEVASLPDANPEKIKMINALKQIKALDELRIIRNMILDGQIAEAMVIMDKLIQLHDGKILSGLNSKTQIWMLRGTGKIGLEKLFVRAHLSIMKSLRNTKWRMRPIARHDLGYQ